MKSTRILVLALCLTVCLSGYAEKRKKKADTSTYSSTTQLRIDEGGYKHEVLLNGNTQVVPLNSGSAGGNIGVGSGLTAINFALGYNYDVIPMLQIGIFPALAYSTIGGVGGTMFSIVAGPTLNLSLDGDIQNAFFLSGALGFYTFLGNGGFEFRFDLGKRFKIWDHISYQPSFGILYTGGNAGTTVFVFNLMGASVHF